jgi:hypothetical protein
MLTLPDYWLSRPNVTTDDAEKEKSYAAFDALLQTYINQDGCPVIEFDTLNLPYPKWQFLCYLTDHATKHDIVLHGSGDPNITLFEPRKASDFNAFGEQTAIYAAADGIWPLFFAIVDRDRFDMSVNNACIRVVDEQGTAHGPYYVFSISASILPLEPWRTGTVYLLPRKTFAAQPAVPLGSSEVHIAQLASVVPVVPLAKLTVTPADFPFLRQIRGHDDSRLEEYVTALQTGAEWPKDL